MSGVYIKKDLCLLDFSKNYFDNYESLLNSKELRTLTESFIEHLGSSNPLLYRAFVAMDGGSVESFIKAAKLICVLSIEEMDGFFDKKATFLAVVEEFYNYYRKMARFSIIHAKNENDLNSMSFITADSNFNTLIINLYRLIEEKLMGSRNLVYRQLQAGTNGSLLVIDRQRKLPSEYAVLSTIPYIHKAMVRTPMILHTNYNKREGIFKETFVNPITDMCEAENFYCMPLMVGDSLTLIYFHKDYMTSAIGLVNLFEVAPAASRKRKPDAIMLFGVPDGKNEETFYYDSKNDIYVGKLSYKPIIEYFGYFKKMALTLHNVCMIAKGMLPIHGAMFNIYFKDGRKKGICLMGDSGAGKSETIETFSNMLGDDVLHIEVIFDDMGTMYELDGKVYAKGTETGAFIRLDDLGNESIYKDIDRSIFINPESSRNARVVTPKTPYEVVVSDHPVDIFLYANNYDDKYGIGRLSAQEARVVYKEGKRMALGTTGEKGISTTFFANPFGPVQKEAECSPIIDRMFDLIEKTGVFLGEAYTRLSYHDEGIKEAAKELIELVKK